MTTAVAEVSRRLRATVRGEDTVARMGGGAFAVLAHGADADADRLADRCLSVVEQPIPTEAGLIELSAGVGVVALGHGIDVDELLGRADLAVRAAHEAGHGSRAPLPGRARRRRRAADLLRHDLQGARARDELFLLFQPIVSSGAAADLRRRRTARWRHGTLGDIPPAEFKPLAERAGPDRRAGPLGPGGGGHRGHGLPENEDPLHVGIKVPYGYLARGHGRRRRRGALRSSGLSAERLVLRSTHPPSCPTTSGSPRMSPVCGSWACTSPSTASAAAPRRWPT